MSLPPGMLPHFYNANSSSQASVANACAPLLERAAREVPLPEPAGRRALTVAEWGCASGGNSVAPVLHICRALQQRLPPGAAANDRLQVVCAHADVATNSWSELFECCSAYVTQAHATCPGLRLSFSAIGRSMYAPNHPRGSVDMGFSFCTQHWQSKKAVVLSHTLFPVGERVLPEEHAALQANAIADLTTFLRLRAEEFCPGGLLVLGLVSCHAEGSWETTYHRVLQDAAAEMVAEGLLQESWLGLMAPPAYFLSQACQEQVLNDVSDSWQLLHHELHLAKSPTTAAWEAGQSSNEALAEDCVRFFRAVAQPCFAAGLNAAGLEAPVIAARLDDLFARTYKAACVTPAPLSWPFAAILLKRVS